MTRRVWGLQSGVAAVALALSWSATSSGQSIDFTRAATNTNTLFALTDGRQNFPEPKVIVSAGVPVTFRVGYTVSFLTYANSLLQDDPTLSTQSASVLGRSFQPDIILEASFPGGGFAAEPGFSGRFPFVSIVESMPGLGVDSLTFSGFFDAGRGMTERGSVTFTDPTGTLLDSIFLPSNLSILAGFSGTFSFDVPFSVTGPVSGSFGAIPEPASILMAGLGGLGVLGAWVLGRSRSREGQRSDRPAGGRPAPLVA